MLNQLLGHLSLGSRAHLGHVGLLNCGLMAPPNSRRNFVDTLRSIAADNGLEFLSLSKDWIIQCTDPDTGRRCGVFGYTFDLNPAAAVEICKEKSATSLVLAARGVPNIPHSVFLSPGNQYTAAYVGKKGVWTEIQALVSSLGFPVVVKPLKGTGGLDVMKATCWTEVEAAVQHIFGREYGLAVSPYKRVKDEYRCVCLDTDVAIVYRKVRSHIEGDGKSSLQELLAQRLQLCPPEDAAGLSEALRSLGPEELVRRPAEGEAVPLQWKHNLGQGGKADLAVPEDMKSRLSEVARQAVGAIGMRFCSVDVVDVEDEGLMVMEVNGGVMMDSLMGQLGEEGVRLAKRLYEAAVLRALGRTPASA